MSKGYDARLQRLGIKISDCRKSKGMTQAQLAEAVGISRTHMSNIEAPQMPTQVSVETLLTIAYELETSIDELFR